jgi:Leucine Rich repeat
MPTEPNRRPWWRFIRFSLRGLIVIVLVIGGSLGWIVHGARVQSEAVAAIEKAGGVVSYEWEGESLICPSPSKRGSGHWVPRWIVKLVGIDYFDHVSGVALSDEDSAAALSHLRDLPHIKRLFLMGPCLTDDELLNLEGLHRLEFLCLRGSNVTDAGMKRVKNLSSLAELDLDRTRISDAGLAELEPLSSLWNLSLVETNVGDAGLAHLKELAGLRHLNLRGTRVTDAGVRDLLQARPSLEIIR